MMKILVAIKRVVDPYVKIKVRLDETAVDTDNLKMAMNPFCEIALEEAVRLKEAGIAQEVIAVSIGPNNCQETLRQGLALGADRAVLIEQATALEPLAIAKCLQYVAIAQQVDIVFLGKQSIDGDHNQTGQMLAALLQWPQATFASKVVIKNNQCMVTREIDGGLQTVVVNMPVVITVDLRLNQLPLIMQAKRKPIDIIPANSLPIDVTSRQHILRVTAPPKRQMGIRVGSVEELVNKLRYEAKII